MHIDIQFLPFPPNPNLLSDRVIVVIDVLRATSVMVHAMSQGASEIIPLATVEEAFRMAKAFPRGFVILGGERKNKEIPGFDLGNSPKEYVAERVKGEEINPDDNQRDKGISYGFFRKRDFRRKFFKYRGDRPEMS